MRAARSRSFLAAALCLALLSIVAPGDARLEPPGGVALARGPYLQLGTPTGVVVRWRTDLPADSRVVFGIASELPGYPPVSPTLAALGESVGNPAPVTEHEVAITGLAPNTRYYYAVGHTVGVDFVALAGGDEQHFFDTAPPAGTAKPTRVWVLGDSGQGGAPVASVRDAYAGFTAGQARGGQSFQHTELWLMLGDNAYPNGSDQEYQATLFDVFPEMLGKSVLWPSIGNHDLWDPALETWPYFASFSMPKQAEAGGVPSASEAYYSFDYANVHFISLDSQNSDRTPNGPMLTWLEADLVDTTQDWIVAFWHHPPYSKGSHDSDDPVDSSGRMHDMRENVLPILEDYGVDLVLSGHSHSYERSYLLDGHYGLSDTFLESMKKDGGDGDPSGDGPYLKLWRGGVPYPAGGDGAIYTVAGSSSQTEQGKAVDLGGTVPNHPAMVSTQLALGSVVLDFNGNRLDARFLDDAGIVRDQFTILKGAPTLAPVADFGCGNRVVIPGASVEFDDLSDNDPTLWRWDFEDDGGIDSNQPNPTRLYPQKGAYDVKLAVSNSAGGDDLVRSQYICVVSGAPSAIDDLRVGTDHESLEWSDDDGATSYQIVRGNLGSLLATQGNFALAGLSCLDTVSEPHSADPTLPGANRAFFYLVRGTNCAPETGTYDSTGTGLAASRDLTIQGSPGTCGCPAGNDLDQDGYCDEYDNCPEAAGDPADLDGDGIGDLCDVCTADALNDADADGFCADLDNCPATANPAQIDTDGDASGDACDPDDDNDGVPDGQDGASLDPLVCRDADGDGCDDCASGADDPAMDGIDVDADGTCDLTDDCLDIDGDGLGDGSLGNLGCVNVALDSHDSDPLQCADLDGDGCDDCSAGAWNPGQDGEDEDVDGWCDSGDNCRTTPNPSQADLDTDGKGDACDLCTDLDGDGFADPGFPASTCPLDNCPSSPNPSQTDSDVDGLGDPCDSCAFDPFNDADMDFKCANLDNCPTVYNPQQHDADGDSIGNACDLCTDTDGDGFGNPGFPVNTCPLDNCPATPNASQANTDGDSWGNACDPDDDNDGVPDQADAAPLDRFLCQDSDADTCDDCASGTIDPANDGQDDDGDGACNLTDPCILDPFDDLDGDGNCADTDNCPTQANSDQLDADGDDIGDACEYAQIGGQFYIFPTEVTNAEYVEMLNAVAALDVHGLFDPSMASDPRGGISRLGSPGAYQYVVKPFMGSKPVNFVAWLGAARYANWLHNGKPTGDETTLTTETGAYDLTVPNPGVFAVRSPAAGWFLPTREEWDEAAYGDPLGADWLYPTHSHQFPGFLIATATGDGANPGVNLANYGGAVDWNGQAGNVTSVAGAGPTSASAWGTYDQAGNVSEWVETSGGGSLRQTRGGSYSSSASVLASTASSAENHATTLSSIGFRIAAATCIDTDDDGFGVPWTPGCSGGLPDNCPAVANPNQADHDGDGHGDLCDDDDDNDGFPDSVDCAPLAAGVSNPPESIGATLLLENDGGFTLHWLPSYQGHTTNVYTATRAKGAGMPVVFSCLEPEVPGTEVDVSGEPPLGAVVYYTLAAANLCGASPVSVNIDPCVSPGADSDSDSIPDLGDNCATVANPDQTDGDGDFVGNACDVCPYAFDPDQADADDNGVGNACEP